MDRSREGFVKNRIRMEVKKKGEGAVAVAVAVAYRASRAYLPDP